MQDELGLPTLDMTMCPEVVVVGAHPDDETLGFGGAAATLAQQGVRVQIVSASDGGAACPNQSLLQRYQLERTRRAELHRAVRFLGVHAPICLGLPDGDIERHEERLADLLTEILDAKPAGTWCAATWRGDGHPDHEAVGRAAAVAVQRTGAVLLEYPVRMWQWALPNDESVPWLRALAVAPSREALERKRLAVQSFESRLEAAAPHTEPVMPAPLRSWMATGEVVFC
jgi:LmbE family N-acetylglucosaminyl deacetylase